MVGIPVYTDFKDKDSYMNMQRALIVNDDEMTATNNSDFETLKKFISSEELNTDHLMVKCS